MHRKNKNTYDWENTFYNANNFENIMDFRRNYIDF